MKLPQSRNHGSLFRNQRGALVEKPPGGHPSDWPCAWQWQRRHDASGAYIEIAEGFATVARLSNLGHSEEKAPLHPFRMSRDMGFCVDGLAVSY